MFGMGYQTSSGHQSRLGWFGSRRTCCDRCYRFALHQNRLSLDVASPWQNQKTLPRSTRSNAQTVWAGSSTSHGLMAEPIADSGSDMGVKTEGQSAMDHKHALANVRSLVQGAMRSNDLEAVHKILEEVLRIVDKATPRRRRTD